MKPRELHHVLGGGKLALRLHNRSRHVCYQLWLSDQLLHLPRLVTLSFGSSGEVTSKVVGGCARDLGLTEREFEITVRCEIGRSCVLLAIAVFCHEAKIRFGLTKERGWDESDHPLDETINTILLEVGEFPKSHLSSQESKLISRLAARPFDKAGIGLSVHKRLNDWLLRT